MSIKAFKDAKRKSEITELKLPYEPSSLKTTMGNKYTEAGGLNSISGDIQFQRSSTACLDVDFVLDSTNYDNLISFGLGTQSVEKMVKKITKAIYTQEGSSHEPPFLMIKWGNMPIGDSKAGGFYCRLASMDISNKATQTDGTPTIAVVKCKFIECLSASGIKSKVPKSSPDLTHVRQVHQGDRLDLLTNDIYQTPDYPLQIAEFNQLDSIRELSVVTQIQLPPIAR